jgi:alkanesulfonate monooxygenase SsuD/methylene tetrahydromethanopterin reductase-like flavin-dependent oxidoreductase (luciferase family)
MTVSSIDHSPRRALAFTPIETHRRLLVEAAIHAEDDGYEAVIIPEGWGLDATVVLADIARQTSRIRLVAGVLSMWGRSPATLAMTAATLAELSQGRFVLGLGTSTRQLAERFHGVPFRQPAGRLAATVDTVRALLRGDRAPGVSGAPGLRLGREPRPDVPIWVAGLGRQAAAVAVSSGDAWFPVMIPRTVLAARTLEVAGGQARPCELVTGPLVGVDGAGECRGRADVEQTLGWYLTGMGPHYGDFVARHGYAEIVDALRAANPKPAPGRIVWPADADPLLEDLAMVGDAATVADGLRAWDRLADVVAVATGPTTAANLHRLIEVCAPPDPGTVSRRSA